MMEAVVTKMSRIIAHVSSGEKGSHVLQKLQVRKATKQDAQVINLMNNHDAARLQSILKATWCGRRHFMPN